MNKLRAVILLVAALITILSVILLSPDVASQEEKSTDTSGQYSGLYLRAGIIPPKQPKTPLKTQSVASVGVLVHEDEVKDYAYRRVCEIWGCEQWYWFNELVMRESGWKSYAQNKYSTAYGLMQFLDSTWQGTGYTKTSDPYQQLEAGFIYIQNRYGTPYRAILFHNANNWY